jgi:hypothetical protein
VARIVPGTERGNARRVSRLALLGVAVAGWCVAVAGAAASPHELYNYGDAHGSIGQSPPHPGRQGDHPHMQKRVAYGASTFPLPITLRAPDNYWGGIQQQSQRFRFVQLFHNHRAGDPPLAGVGEVTFESATGATPPVALTVEHLRATPHTTAGPITSAPVAGFVAKQFDLTIVGSDHPLGCAKDCPRGVSLAPFTTNHHCGFCTRTMHGETLDAKYADEGQLYRIIVLGVHGKTLVIYLESTYADQPRLPPTKTFPTFLPYARQLLAKTSL